MTVITGVLQRCAALGDCTDEPGRVTRTFLSPAMERAHQLVREWMQAAGMRVRVDAVGNLIGRYEQAGGPPKRTLLVGSHLDTVPNGGKYDGMLGVVLGIAAVEALNRAAAPLPFAIDVIAFSEEEGVRFGTPYLGSRALAGDFDPRLLALKDKDGVSVERAIREFGLDPAMIPLAAYERGSVIGYVEAHIEQGPVLEQKNLPVGVVSAIAGQSKARMKFTGRAGHAGTVPMAGRKDALAAAAEFILAVERVGREAQGLVATVGQLLAEPGATNVIPGSVTLSLDVRHADDTQRRRGLAQISAEATAIAARRGAAFQVLTESHQSAVPMDGRLSDLLGASIAQCGAEPLGIVSGAGHDAAIMASLCPVTMLFVRNPGGVSHHPDESVLPEDVEVARRVLISLVQTLAERV